MRNKTFYLHSGSYFVVITDVTIDFIAIFSTEDKKSEEHSKEAPLPSQNIGEPGRRSSLPSNLLEEKHKKPMQCSSSESYLSQMDSKDKYLKLADPLEKSVLNNLELLEGLAKYLDQGDPHGNPKCWRNLAEHFGVEASIYQTFTCSPRSPTEKLFAYLENRDGDKFTIEILKSGLHDIDRKDIITNILVKHQVLGKSAGHLSIAFRPCFRIELSDSYHPPRLCTTTAIIYQVHF